MKYPFNILEHPTGENIFNPTDKNKKDDKVRKCLKVVDFETTLVMDGPQPKVVRSMALVNSDSKQEILVKKGLSLNPFIYVGKNTIQKRWFAVF